MAAAPGALDGTVPGTTGQQGSERPTASPRSLHQSLAPSHVSGGCAVWGDEGWAGGPHLSIGRLALHDRAHGGKGLIEVLMSREAAYQATRRVLLLLRLLRRRRRQGSGGAHADRYSCLRCAQPLVPAAAVFGSAGQSRFYRRWIPRFGGWCGKTRDVTRRRCCGGREGGGEEGREGSGGRFFSEMVSWWGGDGILATGSACKAESDALPQGLCATGTVGVLVH